MRVALGSDEGTHLTDFLAEELRQRGYQVALFGPPAGKNDQWADVARQVAEAVARGECEQGIVCCWTGTGVSIAANKIAGVRAALCADAETARGARLWNDANVLCLSLRTTSEAIAREILDAWLNTTQPDPSEAVNIDKVKQLDRQRQATTTG